ncbi:hypothetical protein AKO1_014214, partial [Acrasis kona]
MVIQDPNITKCNCPECNKINLFLNSNQLEYKVQTNGVLSKHFEQSIQNQKDMIHCRVSSQYFGPSVCQFFYHIKKNIQAIELDRLEKERESLSMYQRDLFALLYQYLVSGTTQGQLGNVIKDITRHSLKNPVMAVNVIMFLKEQETQEYVKIADEMSATIVDQDYQQLDKIPVQCRYRLAVASEHVNKKEKMVKYYESIYASDPCLYSILHLESAYRKNYPDNEQEVKTLLRKHCKQLATDYNVLYENRMSSTAATSHNYYSQVINRCNVSRLKDHLHILTSVSKDAGLAHYISSTFDPDNAQTIVNLMSYQFKLLNKYNISPQRVDQVYFEFLNKFHVNLLKLDRDVVNGKSIINDLYLTIAKCGFGELAVKLGQLRTTALLGKQVDLMPWLHVLCTIYQYAGLAANNTFENYLVKELCAKLTNNEALKREVMTNPLLHPNQDVKPPAIADDLETPYQTDVP